MAEADLTFYYAPRSRAGIVLWMLEELGEPYEIEQLSFKKANHKSPDYLAINPMGKVPAIKHRDVIVTEAAAICCYLADAFPDAGLAPPIGDRRRGAYLRWLFFSPSCIEPAMNAKAFKFPDAPASAIGYGDFDTVMKAVAGAVSQGDYILGDMFSAADVVIGSALNYGMMFGVIPHLPEFDAYTARLRERAAYKSYRAKDEAFAKAAEDA